MAALGKPKVPSIPVPEVLSNPGESLKAIDGALTGAVGNVRSVGGYIREQREAAQISLRQLAVQAGVSNPYLSQIERGLRRPSAEILQQIATALRISAEALYVQAGILDEKHVSTDVTAAIHADDVLSERQKQVLLDIYASFRTGAPTHSPAPQPEATQEVSR